MTARAVARVCNFCVMSDDVSGVVIGTDGRCDRCLDAIARRPHEYWPGPQGAVRMARLVARLRREGRRSAYDAVVGLSGGIDSAYLAHVMATKHDLRLLAVHVDGGWNSEPAVHNIEKIVRGTKMDLVTSVIEWDEMRDLQRAFLRAGVYNQDFPQDHAFFSTLIAVAQHYGVKTFLSGVNFATESVSVPHGGPSSIDGKHLAAIHKQFGTGVLRSYPVTTAYDYLYATRIRGVPQTGTAARLHRLQQGKGASGTRAYLWVA